jgi:carbonic anhydrase
MSHLKRMLVENVAWSREISARDTGFFTRLAEGQQPRVLWIGCADSRVPAESITNSQPGELFVHRNIANLVSADDGNVLSVLEYAIHVLKVEHVIICGHHCCGGVRAALSPPVKGIPHVNRHIAPLRELAQRAAPELDMIKDFDARADRLAELNVIEQVRALGDAPMIRNAAQKPQVHGWIFRMRDGILTPLADTAAAPKLERVATATETPSSAPHAVSAGAATPILAAVPKPARDPAAPDINAAAADAREAVIDAARRPAVATR